MKQKQKNSDPATRRAVSLLLAEALRGAKDLEDDFLVHVISVALMEARSTQRSDAAASVTAH
jgi:hypothetical protein